MLKKFIISCFTVIAVFGAVECPTFAAEKENIKEMEVTVKNNTSDIMPLATYSTKKTVKMTDYITAYPTIYVDANTGTIVGTACPTNNSDYITYYNVGYNSNKTIAYFTITSYTKSIFGGIDHAVATKYATIYSGGPMR